jgi:hypothetical protein
MLGFHDEMGLAVELNHLTSANIVGCGHEGGSIQTDVMAWRKG